MKTNIQACLSEWHQFSHKNFQNLIIMTVMKIVYKEYCILFFCLTGSYEMVKFAQKCWHYPVVPLWAGEVGGGKESKFNRLLFFDNYLLSDPFVIHIIMAIMTIFHSFQCLCWHTSMYSKTLLSYTYSVLISKTLFLWTGLPILTD